MKLHIPLTNPCLFVRVVLLLAIPTSITTVAVAHDGSHERIDRITKEIASNPSSVVLYVTRATAYRDEEDFDAALHDFEQALILDPAAIRPALLRAKTLFEAGRVEESLTAVQALMLAYPDHAEARRLRARAHDSLGAHPIAARDFDHVIARTRKPSPDLILEGANAHAAAGDLRAALAVLRRGSESLGVLSIFEERSIALEIELGDFPHALARIDRMLERSTRKERLLSRRGEILEAAGRSSEAMRDYQKALDSLALLPRRLRGIPASRALEESLQRRLRLEAD